MRSNRKSQTSFINILIIILLIICIGGTIFQVNNLQKWTISQFGIPAPILNKTDLLVYSFRLFINQSKLLNPLENSSKEKTFIIGSGESIQSITLRLQDEGIIRDANAFRYYLIYSGMDTSIQAGEYQINPSINAVQIARKLQDATPKSVKFGILPGWRLEEVAESLATSGLSISYADFIKESKDIGLLPDKIGTINLKTLEGFLFPKVYTIERTANARDLFENFVKGFESNVDETLRTNYANHNLNLLQAVTLASIVQREAIHEDEQPLIASVFYNRLSAGMKLQSDPTTQYALGYNDTQKTWWKNPLSLEDLLVQSMYNTYVIDGLPPGPISNPGSSALRAVANPEMSNYLYFRAKCDGSGYHNFSINYEEHVAHSCP